MRKGGGEWNRTGTGRGGEEDGEGRKRMSPLFFFLNSKWDEGNLK